MRIQFPENTSGMLSRFRGEIVQIAATEVSDPEEANVFIIPERSEVPQIQVPGLILFNALGIKHLGKTWAKIEQEISEKFKPAEEEDE